MTSSIGVQGQAPTKLTRHLSKKKQAKDCSRYSKSLERVGPARCTRLRLALVQDRQAVTWWDLQARCLLFESTIHFSASAAHLSFKSRSKKMDSSIAFVSALRANALHMKSLVWVGSNRSFNQPS